ncbi:MAG: ankyrin repeat domain-containing protein [Paracoccaceae bacterium]
MPLSLDRLRRAARDLRRAHLAGDPVALQRLRQHPPRAELSTLKHADYLHVIALEQSFSSWPRLKLAAETEGLDRAMRQQRLKLALFHGQNWVVDTLLRDTPDLARGLLGLEVALYDRAAVAQTLAQDPAAATRAYGPRRPILHLAFSRWLQAHPEREADMIAIAEMLVAHGADVNDCVPVAPGSDHGLSALYGAIGHAGNLPLARWLLTHGADPDDGESLYHATELGHRDGLRLLLEHGADPRGTNALLRAMDFHDHEAVALLVAHGARADDFDASEVGGEAPWIMPALHQAARRMSDARMIALLLDAGADPRGAYQGASAYAFARVFANSDLAAALTSLGAQTPLSREESLLAAAAEGRESPGEWIDPAKLAPAYRDLLRQVVALPGRLGHVRRLVALGLPYDAPDAEGLTPVQLAGWEGLPDVMAYFLSLRPDLGHINSYGGTLLSTIIHGSENCPERRRRDHVACARLALEQGVALPRSAIALAGEPDMAEFLADWAAERPGQVVDG